MAYLKNILEEDKPISQIPLRDLPRITRFYVRYGTMCSNDFHEKFRPPETPETDKLMEIIKNRKKYFTRA
jgi:hypothetical protein